MSSPVNNVKATSKYAWINLAVIYSLTLSSCCVSVKGLGAVDLVFQKIFVLLSALVMLLACLPFRQVQYTRGDLFLGISFLLFGSAICHSSVHPAMLGLAVPFFLLGISYFAASSLLGDVMRVTTLGSISFVLLFLLYSSNTIVYDLMQAYSLTISGFTGIFFFGVKLEEGFSVSGGWILVSFVIVILSLFWNGLFSLRAAASMIMCVILMQPVFIASRLYFFSSSCKALGLVNLQYLFLLFILPFIVLAAFKTKLVIGSINCNTLQCDSNLKNFKGIISVALAFACSLLLGLVSFSFNGLPIRITSDRSVLLLEAGFLDWKVPTHEEYGLTNGGLFGILPTAFRMIDVASTISSEIVTENLLKKHNILVIINAQRRWTEEELQCIRQFVHDGGSLIVLGDHTDLLGTQTSLNRLTLPFGIEFNFDSGYPCREQWHECLEFRTHPINAGLSRSDQASISIGATLKLSRPAIPAIIGKYGFSDWGIRENVQGAFLGNYTYEIGERFGDVVLVATSEYGMGKVLVFADTSSFQNTAFITDFDPFFLNIVSWLSAKPEQRLSTYSIEIIQLALWIVLMLVLVVVYRRSPSCGLPLLYVTFCIGCLAAHHIYSSPASRLKWQPTLERPVAWIDRCYLPQTPVNGMHPDGVSGLTLNLFRNGFFPMHLWNKDFRTLDEGKLLFLLRPVRQIDKGARRRFSSFMNKGGIIVLTCGYPDKQAVEPLLDLCDLDMVDIPLGPVPVADRQPGLPQFVDAWPISHAQRKSTDKGGSSVGSSLQHKILFEKNGLANVVFTPIGQGGLLLISDGRYLGDSNLESLQGHHKGNIDFIKSMLERLTKHSGNPSVTNDKIPHE